MKRLFIVLLLVIFSLGCIHRQSQENIQQVCERPIAYDNLKIRAKTKLNMEKEKLTIISNIYVNNGMTRVDILGVFDDIISTLIVKENKLYFIDYSHQTLYTFNKEEELYKLFNISIPFLTLPYILTLSSEGKKLIDIDQKDNIYIYSNDNGDKFILFIEPTYCTVKKAELSYYNKEKIKVVYSDFSTLNEKRIFHKIYIQSEKKDIETEIKFLKISSEEIDEGIFDINRFKDFKNVVQ